MTDWVTISSLATAGGTLVLAVATFASVRSANRSARLAEQALQEQRRPVLVTARLDDPKQKIGFADGHWVRVEGSQAVIEDANDSLYLALALRNVGAGIAVLQGWYCWPDQRQSGTEHAPADDFRRLTRDIYIAPGDIGMWQGAFRDPDEQIRQRMAAASSQREPFSLDLLYSDQVGGQRTISRFGVMPAGESGWLGSVARHWTLDDAGPR